MPTDNELLQDIEAVKQIAIIDNILEVICQVTGMGFAAVARVTDERWIACGVRDEINFGMKPGSELELKTTICDEIRASGKAVVIDNVSENKDFCNHHTPKMYGFQSYISIPIILKNGQFFGTLCAIDPNPAQLNNSKVIGLFSLFADLISFHLQSIQIIERSRSAVTELKRDLVDTLDENRQYQYITNHDLQEPLRKIMMFSTMLLEATETKTTMNPKDIAVRINANAQRFSRMIRDLSDFSKPNFAGIAAEAVDLNKTLIAVQSRLEEGLRSGQVLIEVEELPLTFAVAMQMEDLFHDLLYHVMSLPNSEPLRRIHIHFSIPERPAGISEDPVGEYMEVRLEDHGLRLSKSEIDKMFDMFSQIPFRHQPKGNTIGLAYCRKIVRNHGGDIRVESNPEKSTVFSITLPLHKAAVQKTAEFSHS